MAFDRGVTLIAPTRGGSFACPSGHVYVADQRGFIFSPNREDVSFLEALGCQRTSPRNQPHADRAPLRVDDDTKLYGVGSQWTNINATGGPATYTCVDPTTNNAVWVLTLSATGVPSDVSIATILPNDAKVAVPLQSLYAELGNNVSAFGGLGDGLTDDSGPIMDTVAASFKNGSPLFLKAGRYKLSAPLNIDLRGAPKAGLWITGAGAGRTVIDGRGLKDIPVRIFGGGGTPQAQTDCFFGGLRDISILGDGAMPVLELGTPNFADAINSYELTNVIVKNENTTGGAIGTRINYLVSSSIRNLVTNCSGKGVALSVNQAAICSFFSGSFSTAETGLHITNGFNFGNTFASPDIEVVDYCVRQDSSHSQYNVIKTGSFVWNKFAVSSSAGGTGGLTLDRVNLGTSGLHGKSDTALDPNNAVAVHFLGHYGDGSTPPFPAPGDQVKNTSGQAQMVTFWANPGDLTSVTINGTQTMKVDSGLTGLAVQLRPGYTIEVTGTGGNWVWYPLDA